MNASQTPKQDRLRRIEDRMIEDILASSPDDLRNELREDGQDPEALIALARHIDHELLHEVRYILRKWQRDEFPEEGESWESWHDFSFEAAIEEITEAFTDHKWRENPERGPDVNRPALREHGG